MKDRFSIGRSDLRIIASALFVLCSTVNNRAFDFPPNGKNPIRVAAFGDSIVWGQGLHDEEKFYSLIADAFGIYAGVAVEKNLLAHSGATIVPDGSDGEGRRYHGEIPQSYPTINEQVDSFGAFPETIDLVIIDGGINDVNVANIIDPLNSEAGIEFLSFTFCYQMMDVLLAKVVHKFPNAQIVVTAYFQIISEQTDQDVFETILDVYGVASGGNDAVIRNCRKFNDVSKQHLRDAVASANAGLLSRGQSPRVYFADPSFLPQNATFAPQTWLWGLRLNAFPLTHYLDPLDPWADFREENCEFFSLGYSKCRRASVGHPTPRGARAYASGIASALGFAWTDFSRTNGGEDRMEFPFQTLWRAVDHVPTGGTILIRSSTTSETIRISKACKLRACAGPVTIGKIN